MRMFVILLCIPASALAAPPAPDLVTTFSAPTGTPVYDTATYSVTVDNIGNGRANNVDLTIDLPATHTSPTIYVMGTVGAMSSECSASGLQLVCDLGRIRKGQSSTITFDIALPQSTDDLVVEASASTSRETNLGNNSDSVVADLVNVDVIFGTPLGLTIEHCTGQDLSSFFECETSPSSISSHTSTLNADGSISFPAPGFTGAWWSDDDDHLAFEYYDAASNTVVEFEGFGVDPDCWEGIAQFPTNPTYLSVYSVCR